ncbi:MAG: thioesterase [Bacteroidota bacterium]
MTSDQHKLAKKISKGTLFSFYLFCNLPMGWIAGLRIKEINENRCITSVPFKWLTKNPFQSIYFAVQAMAAELSTATTCLLAVQGQKPSIAFIIVNLEANFTKKATDKVFFVCEDIDKAFDAVKRCIETDEATEATFKSIGKMKDNTIVSEFEFTWSFKQRKS